jgi:pancreatic triacylglycerol lipase
LDPAGPLFSVRNAAGRLDASDANYVECIHTNGPTLVLVGAGIGAPIGHADFFPNGGTSQPGCLTNTCSHGRAVDFYGKNSQINF